MSDHRNQESLGPYQDPASSEEPDGGVSGVMIRGLAAVLVFVTAALILQVIGYSYGALLDLSPEYPFIMSLSFMLGALVVVFLFPMVGGLASRAESGLIKTRTAIAAGAGFGSVSMAIVWLLTSGPGTDPFDWPELLYLLQLTLSGAAAGMVLCSGFVSHKREKVASHEGSDNVTSETVNNNSANRRGISSRLLLVTSLLFLIALSVPFLLMWQARRAFSEEAQQQALYYFRLPAGFSMATTAESSGFGSLEKNVRYRAGGVQDEAGRRFSVDVIGERNHYDFGIREVSASLWAPAVDFQALVEWDDSEAGQQTQKAVLELAGAYVRSPLEIVSAKSSGPSGKMIVMRGDGIEVVARPGGSSPEAPGVHLAFTAKAR